MKKTLPKFKNYEEEANFWDTHCILDYAYDKPIKVTYEPEIENKETMTLRLTPSVRRKIEKLAKEYQISTSSLIRMWIVEKLKVL
jgi:hypothetical protein